MMKTTIFVLILGGALSLPAIAASSYTVDPKHTFPSLRSTIWGFQSNVVVLTRPAAK